MLLPGDWVTGDGYGSAEKKSENLVILTGDPELNSDNSHSAAYIKNDGLIEDGTLVDELYIYLDPAELAQAEKFILTSGLNNKSDAYADEFAVMFQKDGKADQSFGRRGARFRRFADRRPECTPCVTPSLWRTTPFWAASPS